MEEMAHILSFGVHHAMFDSLPILCGCGKALRKVFVIVFFEAEEEK